MTSSRCLCGAFIRFSRSFVFFCLFLRLTLLSRSNAALELQFEHQKASALSSRQMRRRRARDLGGRGAAVPCLSCGSINRTPPPKAVRWLLVYKCVPFSDLVASSSLYQFPLPPLQLIKSSGYLKNDHVTPKDLHLPMWLLRRVSTSFKIPGIY